jgi:hypothetical protein
MRPYKLPNKPLSPKDKTLIMRVAVALAEFYGKSLCKRHFERAERMLCRSGAPLEDRVPELGFTGPDVESLVG